MLQTKYQGSMVSGFRQEDISKFSSRKFILCDLDMQRTRTIGTILVEVYPRIICGKLFQNWTRGLEGDVIYANN